MKKILLLSILCLTPLVGFNALLAQQQIVIQKVDTAYQAVTNLKITGSFAQIALANGEDGVVSFKGSLAANEKVAGFELTHKMVAGTLEIVISYPSNNWVTHSGELNILVPKGLSVEIENTSGYVNISAASDLKVNATTTSGKIFVTDSKGDYALRSTSGDITTSKSSGNLMLTSNSGKITAKECSGEVNITNLSGESSVTSHEGNIVCECTSGKLLIETIKGNVTAKSASAPMKISKVVGNLTLKSFSGAINLFDIKGIIMTDSGAGDQVGAQIVLSGNSKFVSTEGSIKMRLVNPTTDLTFKLLSEQGFIQARTQSKKKKLNSGKGALLIESFSTTGGQVFN